MSTVKHVNDNDFDSEVLTSTKPVLVDFSAVWCGPCQRQAPIIAKFADANVDKVKVCEVDIDESPALSSRFGIRSVPTLILFVNGKPFHTKVGLNSLVVLETMLQSVIAK